MSSTRHSWFLPLLTVVTTMVATGAALFYLNPAPANALDDAAPAGSSIVLATAEKPEDTTSVCRSGSNVCVSASLCSGAACAVEECVSACERVGIECSEECTKTCGEGGCSGECSTDSGCSGVCAGGGSCSGSGACKTVVPSSTSSGCCSRS